MFFVFNKRKIGSYLISIGTVAILFSIALFGEHFGDGEKNVQNELFGEIFQIVLFLKIEDLLRKSSINGKN